MSFSFIDMGRREHNPIADLRFKNSVRESQLKEVRQSDFPIATRRQRSARRYHKVLLPEEVLPARPSPLPSGTEGQQDRDGRRLRFLNTSSELGPETRKSEAGDSTLRSQFPFASSGGMIYAGSVEESMQECDAGVRADAPSGGPLDGEGVKKLGEEKRFSPRRKVREASKEDVLRGSARPGGFARNTSFFHPFTGGTTRREFLRTSATGTAILGSAAFFTRCTRQESALGAGLAVFTAGEFTTLSAFCQAVLPGPEASEAVGATPARIDREVSHWSARNRSLVKSVLALIEEGTRYFLFSWRPFSQLSVAGRQEYLSGWETSALDLRRQAYQVMRMLALFYYYSQDATWKAIGYDGPWVKAFGH